MNHLHQVARTQPAGKDVPAGGHWRACLEKRQGRKIHAVSYTKLLAKLTASTGFLPRRYYKTLLRRPATYPNSFG